MTFSIVDYDPKQVQASASASGNKITIGGVKSTYDDVNGTNVHVRR